MKRLVVMWGVLGAFACSGPAFAHPHEDELNDDTVKAATDAKPATGSWRDGWILGIGPVGGYPLNNHCDECSTSPAFGMEMQVGRMLNPRLGLMLDVHGVAIGRSDIRVYDVSNTSVVQGVVAAAVQYWPAQKFWLKGGIGHGEAQGMVTVVGAGGASLDLTEKETGFGMTAATGYELHQGDHFALDLHLRYAGIHTKPKYRGSVVLGVGFAWYL
jgi:hypothetical protein